MHTISDTDRPESPAQYSQNAVADVTGDRFVNCVDTFRHYQNANRLFLELRSVGVVLLIDAGGRLLFDAPAGVMTGERFKLMQSHRDELLDIVKRRDERAEIAKSDGGKSRSDPQQIASDDVVLRAVFPKSITMPEGIRCPYCPGRSLIDERDGCRCATCRRIAWVPLPSGSMVRADYENVVLYFFD